MRIDSPFRSTTANQADSALAVLRRCIRQLIRRIRLARKTIFEHKRRHAVIRQPFGFIDSFVHNPN